MMQPIQLVKAYVKYHNHIKRFPADECAKEALQRFLDSLKYAGVYNNVLYAVHKLKTTNEG